MADGSMFIEIAMLAAAFNIGKAQDEDGRYIEPDCVYKPGIVRYCYVKRVSWMRADQYFFESHPMPFKCSITARLEKAEELMCSILHDNPFEN